MGNIIKQIFNSKIFWGEKGTKDKQLTEQTPRQIAINRFKNMGLRNINSDGDKYKCN